MYEVIGFKESAGEYQGNSYHNINLHCIVPALDTGSFGKLCEIVKIKFDNVPNVFGKSMTSDDWAAIVGQSVDVGYDKFGRVNYVRIVEPAKK